MEQAVIIERVKTALRTTTEDPALLQQLADLIQAGLADLGIAGVNGEKATTDDPLVLQAVITYCGLHFGEPENYERMKASYDEQKGQLSHATGYTVWEVS